MAHKKSTQINSFLQKFHSEYPIILFYGNNYGLISHNAESYISLIEKKLKLDLHCEFSAIKFYVEDLQNLLKEVKTRSFINSTKILWIKEINAGFVSILKEILTLNLNDIYIIIEAKELKASSNLRVLVETHAKAMALPCWIDNNLSLEECLKTYLNLYDLKIDPEARRALLNSFNSDFLIAKSEINKLCTYCINKKVITIEDIKQICNDANNLDLYKIVDSMLQGELFKLNNLFKIYMQNGKNSQILLNIAIKQFQELQNFKYKIKVEKQSIDYLLKISKPPIHFKRQAMMENILSIWQEKAINRALVYLQTQALQARINPKLQDLIVHNALIKIGSYVKQV